MKLENNPATVVFPTKLMAMLTGAWKLTTTGGLSTLEYVDGTKESVPDTALRDVKPDDWLAIVSKVQSMRGKVAA